MAALPVLGDRVLSLRVQLQRTWGKVFELAPPVTQTKMASDIQPAGASIMGVEDMVAVALKGLENDRLEIRPGA